MTPTERSYRETSHPATSCRGMRTLQQRSLDGELAPGDELELRRHHESCSRCRARFTELRDLGALLTEAAETDRLVIRVAPSAPRRVPIVRSAAAAMLLWLTLLWFIPTPRGSSPSPRGYDDFPSELTGVGTPVAKNLNEPERTRLAHPSLALHEPSWLAIDFPSRHPGIHIVWIYPGESLKGPRP